MRIALDTNILAYAEGINDVARYDAATTILRRLPREDTFLPTQVLGELFNALVRKGRYSADVARSAVQTWRDTFTSIEASRETLSSAMDLAVTHQFSIWDAFIVSAAVEAHCRLLLSEDMQHGFVWRGLTIVNPFAPAKHSLLEALLTR